MFKSISNWLCYFGCHNFDKWRYTKDSIQTFIDSDCYGYSQDKRNYKVKVFNRFCKNCGEFQEKYKKTESRIYN